MTLVNIAGEKRIEKERPETDVKEYMATGRTLHAVVYMDGGD